MRAKTIILMVCALFCFPPINNLFSQLSCLDAGCVSSVTGEVACPIPQTEDPIPYCCTTYWNGEPFSETSLDSDGAWSYTTCSGNTYPGGLYEGTNEMPVEHYINGKSIANGIVPLNSLGIPDSSDGKIVMATMGPSNMKLYANELLEIINDSAVQANINPYVEVVNACIPGTNIKDLIHNKSVGPPSSENLYWEYLTNNFFSTTTPEQVQVLFFKYVIRSGMSAPLLTSFESYTAETRDAYVEAIPVLKEHFPNLKQVYLIPLSYKGYMCGPNSLGEPYAYWAGYAIRDVIMQQIDQSVNNTYPELDYLSEGSSSVWVGWGPYIWSDGPTPNKSGISWSCPIDYSDNIHPSDIGGRRVADLFYDFLYTDSIASSWFALKKQEDEGVEVDPPLSVKELKIDSLHALPSIKKTVKEDTSSTIDSIPTGVSIIPNPASSYIEIHSSLIESSISMIIQLYDMYGKMVLYKKTQPNKPIYLNDFPKGMYYYNVYEATGKAHSSGRVLVK